MLSREVEMDKSVQRLILCNIEGFVGCRRRVMRPWLNVCAALRGCNEEQLRLMDGAVSCITQLELTSPNWTERCSWHRSVACPTYSNQDMSIYFTSAS
jgi:hypothetical protein